MPGIWGSRGTDRIPDAATTNGATKVSPAPGLDQPFAGVLVERHRDDFGVEGDVAAQVEPVCDEVEVSLDLGLGRHCLGPHPLPLNLVGEAVGVLDALDVTSGARVSVEQPCPADVFGHLEHARADAEFTQPV